MGHPATDRLDGPRLPPFPSEELEEQPAPLPRLRVAPHGYLRRRLVKRTPYPFQDFERAKRSLFTALVEEEEPYALLTGETGSGKTALLAELRGELDRTRHRVLYFGEARRLGASGLVKVVGESLRVRTSMCHAVTLDRLLRTLPDESRQLHLFADEAHSLPEETLDEMRALAEGDLEGTPRIQILLAGLPKLRAALQDRPSLWRRIVVREEICGLLREEAVAVHGIPRVSEPSANSAGLFARSSGSWAKTNSSNCRRTISFVSS